MQVKAFQSNIYSRRTAALRCLLAVLKKLEKVLGSYLTSDGVNLPDHNDHNLLQLHCGPRPHFLFRFVTMSKCAAQSE